MPKTFPLYAVAFVAFGTGAFLALSGSDARDGLAILWIFVGGLAAVTANTISSLVRAVPGDERSTR